MRKTILLPGMGADSNMYPQSQYGHLAGVKFVDWPPYQGEKTIQAVARRIIDEYHITGDVVIGGSSLGGMVAVEIAKMVALKTVILIGSTTHPNALNPVLMKMSGFAHLAHVDHLQWLAGKINRSGRNLFLSMFQRTNGEFMKAMAQAICTWRGIDGYRCRVCHIHGAKDRVILPPPWPATIVPSAGHLLPMTHGDLVARFIEQHCAASSL